MSTKADAIAKIALDIEWELPDTALTTRNVLRALHQAYEAGERSGFDRGFTAATRNRSQMDELIGSLLP